jgi:hypothetical protein
MESSDNGNLNGATSNVLHSQISVQSASSTSSGSDKWNIRWNARIYFWIQNPFFEYSSLVSFSFRISRIILSFFLSSNTLYVSDITFFWSFVHIYVFNRGIERCTFYYFLFVFILINCCCNSTVYIYFFTKQYYEDEKERKWSVFIFFMMNIGD